MSRSLFLRSLRPKRRWSFSTVDPIEMGVRDRVREFIEAMVEAELEAALSRPRYGRGGKPSNTRRTAHRVSRATVMATGRARYWGLSARSRLRCRAHG